MPGFHSPLPCSSKYDKVSPDNWERVKVTDKGDGPSELINK